MQQPLKLSRRWFLSSCFVLGLAALLARPVFAADDAGNGTHYATVVARDGLSAADVKEVLLRSLRARQWTVVSDADGKVVGHLVHRGLDATLSLVYDARQVDLYYVCWKVDKAGVHIKPEVPERWLKNMNNDLIRRLNPAAAK